ncbi:MAG: hypothetical protein J0L52_01715 [Caulobacterales bacterium]|nr:hypothetical protein [Caulobacterales bacterium]
MRPVTALCAALAGGLMWRGISGAMDHGEIIAFSRRRFIDMVSMADDPLRFNLSLIAHIVILAAAVVIAFRALIERPSNRIDRRRR